MIAGPDIELQPMKFSSTLQFNAVPEWRDHYVDYDQLKKLIFRLERLQVTSFQQDDDSLAGKDPVEVFKKALDKEVQKIDEYYLQIESDVLSSVDQVHENIRHYMTSDEFSAPISSSRSYRDDPEHSAANEDAQAVASESSDEEAPTAHRRKSTIHDELARRRSIPFENVSLRRDITRVYVLLNELLSYSDLNREGIRKALKKFDKVMGTSLMGDYLQSLNFRKVFSDDTNHTLASQIDYLVSGFAKLVGETDSQAAETLSGLLREHVVYERNTVWRELIGLERRTEGVQHGGGQPVAAVKKKYIFTFNIRDFEVGVSMRAIKLLVIFAIFFIMLGINILSSPVQSRCLAIVVLSSLLWATEALPLFVTGLLVPLLVIYLRIPLKDDGVPMGAKEASTFVFSKMWSPVITVLLGGFSLAAALSKYNIAKAMAQAILGRVGTDSPRKVVLVLMFVATFLCMWISNVAAPVLCFSVAQPFFRIVPPGDPFSKSLILGIALASNVGGMASPIASPQNILALQNMDPVATWLEWFAVSLPVSIASVFMIWAFLCVSFPLTKEAAEAIAHIRAPSGGSTDGFGRKHVFVLVVTVSTIILWCCAHQLEPYFGDMGVLAFFPIVLLFGSGVLSAADFNNFLWTIVALAMGGIVLGQSVESCGLLTTVASHIQTRVAHLPLFTISMTLGFAILVLASFISHTVSALIVLPLVKSIGEQLEDPHPRLLVMISALLCSSAMALPTSGFPNVTAVCMVDEFGKPYLTAMDFISRGIPVSVMVYLIIITLGYAICRLLGF